ncbi:unnamed protein product [Echinostoma caproni]|uniref:Deoxyribonuclease TATDN1 n=1 Tax=Echinostoma caproni TaxID=27848 RepID=A0A183BGQ7_9TREM|nr:unnamed protein product [Echinostoma caproni]
MLFLLFRLISHCRLPMASCRRFIDIGANLTDKVFRGCYRGRSLHADDFDAILNRAFDIGSYSDACEAIKLSRTDERLFTTVGCHPTRCIEMDVDPSEYVQQMETLINDNQRKVVAVGECGLDYDREFYCPRDIQRKHFKFQLQLASRVRLPLFLHCRAAHEDLLSALKQVQAEAFHDQPIRGVVHTFDGTWSQAEQFLEMGLYLGVNGCSLKTEDQLAVRAIVLLY